MHARTVNGCNLTLRVMVLLAGLVSQASCTPEGMGRCGTYTPTPGTARITAAETAPADELNCKNDPVRVLFDFTPSDPGAGGAATNIRLHIGSGENPPRAWVEAEGLAIGSVHPAIREDQPNGPCTPEVFTLTDVDTMAGIQACY
jgi:hypothetical protein